MSISFSFFVFFSVFGSLQFSLSRFALFFFHLFFFSLAEILFLFSYSIIISHQNFHKHSKKHVQNCSKNIVSTLFAFLLELVSFVTSLCCLILVSPLRSIFLFWICEFSSFPKIAFLKDLSSKAKSNFVIVCKPINCNASSSRFFQIFT